MQLHILRTSKLEGQIVSNSGSHFWGHWSLCGPLRDTGQHEYCSQKLSWLCGHIQQIQGLASSQPLTLWSQNHTGRRHFPTFGPFTPCPRRNLWLCVSSLTKTLLQGSSVLLAPLHGAPVLFHPEKRWLLRLCVYFQALNWISRKTIPTSLISDLLDTPRKHNSTPKSTSGTLTIYSDCTQRQMENCLPDPLRFLQVVGNALPEGLTMLQQLSMIMNIISQNMIDIIVIIYLDDILIYSNKIPNTCTCW